MRRARASCDETMPNAYIINFFQTKYVVVNIMEIRVAAEKCSFAQNHRPSRRQIVRIRTRRDVGFDLGADEIRRRLVAAEMAIRICRAFVFYGHSFACR